MAVELSKKGTLGCAYYVAQDEKYGGPSVTGSMLIIPFRLFFMEDMQLAGTEMIDMRKRTREQSTRIFNLFCSAL